MGVSVRSSSGRSSSMFESIRHLVAIWFLVVLCCSIPPRAESAPKKSKVGFVLATVNEERYAKDRNYFLEAAKREGVDVEFASCDDKVDVQTAKVETLLSKGID